MEINRISILENFALTTVVMPYYAPTHKSFLLLSSMTTGTRVKLDEFYEEFMNAMNQYWIMIYWDNQKYFNAFALPADLFIMNIWISRQELLESFVRFIKQVNAFEGAYFNNNYMSSHLNLANNRISILSTFITNLSSYTEMLKSITVYKNWPYDSKGTYTTLMESISVNLTFGGNFCFWILIFNLFLKSLKFLKAK